MGNKEIIRQIEMICDEENYDVDRYLEQRDEENEVGRLIDELWSR